MSSRPRRTAGGGWETWVTATVDGRKRRKHIPGRTKKEVIAEAECVRSLWSTGQLPEGGEVTLGAWLTTWMAERKVAGARPSTLSGYRTDLKHLGALSDVRLDKLTPERIGRLWGDLLGAAVGRYSFDVEPFHLLLHAGLARRSGKWAGTIKRGSRQF